MKKRIVKAALFCLIVGSFYAWADNQHDAETAAAIVRNKNMNEILKAKRQKMYANFEKLAAKHFPYQDNCGHVLRQRAYLSVIPSYWTKDHGSAEIEKMYKKFFEKTVLLFEKCEKEKI